MKQIIISITSILMVLFLGVSCNTNNKSTTRKVLDIEMEWKAYD